jgi:hypothetical protein
MVECLKARTAEWDKRMTSGYQQALKDAVPQQREQLRAAQRLWIVYRGANCLYYGLGEGIIARIDAGECMRNMTEVRARELESVGHQWHQRLFRVAPVGLTFRPGKVAALKLPRGSGPAGRFCCVAMTFPLHFYDTPQAPAASSVSWSSPAKAQRQCRV